MSLILNFGFGGSQPGQIVLGAAGTTTLGSLTPIYVLRTNVIQPGFQGRLYLRLLMEGDAEDLEFGMFANPVAAYYNSSGVPETNILSVGLVKTNAPQGSNSLAGPCAITIPGGASREANFLVAEIQGTFGTAWAEDPTFTGPEQAANYATVALLFTPSPSGSIVHYVASIEVLQNWSNPE